MCFDRNINGNRDVKFLIAIIGHCTDQRKLLYQGSTKRKGFETKQNKNMRSPKKTSFFNFLGSKENFNLKKKQD